MTVITFDDYPEFKPNLTPKQIFAMGSFGGTYWRPIYSQVTKKKYKNQHLKYKWGLPDEVMTRTEYNKDINKYKVKVGTSLEFWECKQWIHKDHPYGWVQWYADFYGGARGPDDERQIKRWLQTAGPKSRFRRRLINMINEKKTTVDDYNVSPKIRQTLQHWAVQLDKY